MKSRYSAFLCKTIENLCEINIVDRPYCGQINAILDPYQK